MDKSRKYMIISIIILLISVVGSIGTYAWFTWTSTNNTAVTLQIGKLADVTFESGNDININNLSPTFNYTGGESTTFTINNRDTSGAQLLYTVRFNITSIANELKNSSMKYTLVKGSTVVAEGDFSEAVSGDTLILKTSSLTNGTSNYTLYFWIDSNQENNKNMMNKSLSGTIDVIIESNVITKESTSSSNFLNTEIPKSDITSVSIVSGETPPTGVTPVDVSDAQDGSILMWYTEDGSGNKEAIISSNNTIYAGSNTNAIFSGLTNTTSLDLSNLNTSGMTSMANMFAGDTVLEEIEFGDEFDTSEVTTMYRTFYNTTALTELDLSNFDTSNVTNMNGMFGGSGVTELDLSSFDTSNVTNMGHMFRGCRNLTSLDVSSFNTLKVTNMGCMFQDCSQLTELNISNFQTPNVIDIQWMFYGDNNLIRLLMPNFSTSKINDTLNLFTHCSSLQLLDASNADFSAVTSSSSSMFTNVPTSATIKLKDTMGNRTFMNTNFPSYSPTYIS